MKIFFAGGNGETENKCEIIRELGIHNRLESYHSVKHKLKEMKLINENFNLFMDSGAFSAYNSKVFVNIDNFISYLKKLNVKIFAGLDVIRNAEKTLENINYMQQHGLNPMPTFHRTEDFDYLYNYIDNHDYICLGGMGGDNASTPQFQLWLDRVWHQILKRKPDLKVHGFACSGIKIMGDYPWESVDSTSWLAPVIYGSDVNNKSNEEVLKEVGYDDDHIVHKNEKKYMRKLILIESVKYFLRIEKKINDEHKKSEFKSTTQQDFFD